MIKFKIHSIVDVITNSSTVIYTYQNSVTETKALVAEILKLAGNTTDSPEDVFHYGVFCEDEKYFDKLDYPEDEDEDNPDLGDVPKITGSYGSQEYKLTNKKRDEWFEDFKIKIMTGEVDQPKWMSSVEVDESGYGYDPDLWLSLIPKKPEFEDIGKAIEKLLCSVSADGGMDG